MDAKPRKISDFLEIRNAEFIIPIYQRNYDWKEEHCKQLLNDILEVSGMDGSEQSHFIGSIVYITDSLLSDQKKMVIIDGQQRITTLTLMLIALYHFLLEIGKGDLASEIFEYYIINKRSTEDSKIKLKASEDNKQDLECLIDKQPIPHDYSRVKLNYLFFRNEINDFNWKQVLNGFKKLYFVEISLERGKDNPQKIFESLNSTGLDLSQGDLIRNYVLMGLEPDVQSKLYRRYWEKIELNTNSGNQSYISNFIRDFLTLKLGVIPKKDKVYAIFKKYYIFNSPAELEELLSELLRYSEIYKLFLNPEIITDKVVRKSIFYLNYIEVNVAYPFLLQIFDDYNKGIISKDIFENILKFISSYITRRFVLDLPTNTLNKVFMTLYKQVDKQNYLESLYRYILTRPGKSRMPSDSEIRTYLPVKDLYRSNSKMRKYIFENLENFNNNEKVNIIGEEQITIEHIFPQEPEESWKRELKEKDFIDFKEKFLHTIGNLTLSGYNGKLSNKSFKEKRDMNKSGGEQGYKYSRLWINRGLKDLEEWNIENYMNRSEILTNRFISIWKLPHIEGVKELPEINIEDVDYDSSTMEFEYAVFGGEKYVYRHLSKLYAQILTKLYDLDSDKFIQQCSSIIKLSLNPDNLTRPKPLNKFFYEANLSGEAIFSNLKKVLSILELSDELFIKFKALN